MSVELGEIRGGIEWFTVRLPDGRVEEGCQCARCGSSCDFSDCWRCGGEGYVEMDWGDGIVADLHDVRCESCGGAGGFHFCLSGREWCEANPRPGREHIESTARDYGDDD